MANLDLELLFTNIPIDETIKNAVDDLFFNNMHQVKLSKSELYHLLKLTTLNHPLYLTTFYINKLTGVAMGPPLEPTLANAFLCHYGKFWLQNCPPEFKTIVCRRYNDNIFDLFTRKFHLLSLARYMNTRHKKLRFTFEFEQNNSFFLKC